jgi:hypothetical protein
MAKVAPVRRNDRFVRIIGRMQILKVSGGIGGRNSACDDPWCRRTGHGRSLLFIVIGIIMTQVVILSIGKF